jgi:hypothetical protein
MPKKETVEMTVIETITETGAEIPETETTDDDGLELVPVPLTATVNVTAAEVIVTVPVVVGRRSATEAVNEYEYLVLLQGIPN